MADVVETITSGDQESVDVSSTTSPQIQQQQQQQQQHSRLPVPGSRLPTLRKASTPSIKSETPLTTPKSAKRLSRISLPAPSSPSLRTPSSGRSPGPSPSLKPQGSNSSLNSTSPITPTRSPLHKPTIATRAVSTSTPSPAGAKNSVLASRRLSGLPTIVKTPSKEPIKPATSNTTPIAVSRSPQQPPRPKALIPRGAPAGRKSLPAAVDKPTPVNSSSTLNVGKTPLRSRSFQATSTPTTTTPSSEKRKSLSAAIITPHVKNFSTTPKSGSIKFSKPRPRQSIVPAVEDSPPAVDKRQRALASSQALRDTIAAAKKARKSLGSNATKPNDWPDIVIAGIDDKKKDENKEEGEGEDEDLDDAEPEEEEKNILDIRPGGILDLTYKNISSFDDEYVAETNPMLAKVLLLQRNSLLNFPPVLSRFSGLYTLDLSCNAIKGDDYLTTNMAFPYLKTLLIHSNSLTSITPVTTLLDLPRLNYLDCHGNRIPSYPKGLTRIFPSLTTFIASDNQIEVIELDGLEGLQVLDLMNNSIGTLPPRLGNMNSLRELRVLGNLFRVPRRQILERSTTEVMEWLRDRIVPEDVAVELDDEPRGVEEKGWEVVDRNETY